MGYPALETALFRRICVAPRNANPLLWRWPLKEVYEAYLKEYTALTKRAFMDSINQAGLPTSKAMDGTVTTEGWALEEWVTPKMLEWRP